MNCYVRICFTAFITLMAMILVFNVNVNFYVGLYYTDFITLMAICGV